jgi:hypothetical protein
VHRLLLFSLLCSTKFVDKTSKTSVFRAEPFRAVTSKYSAKQELKERDAANGGGFWGVDQ